MIEPGTADQIKWDDATWIIWDVGFAEKTKSSGLFVSCGKPRRVRFECAKQLIVEHIRKSRITTNLVIEAPLSVCFNEHGNPTPRACIETAEVNGKIQSRRWYQAGGIMIAAMHVIRAITDSAPNAKVRLFEGFVSYKTKGKSSDHCRDVTLLREAIQQPERFAACIHSKEKLRGDPNNRIESAFKVCGLDCGVPVVIKREAPL